MGNLSISNIVANFSGNIAAADVTMQTMSAEAQDHFSMLLSSVGNKISVATVSSETISANASAVTDKVDTSEQTTVAYDASRSEIASKINSSGTTEERAAEVEEAVAESVEEIKEVIKDTLNISDEELAEAMELLGLSEMDLLNPKYLSVLSVQLLGEKDIASLLTNPDFQELSAAVGDIISGLEEKVDLTVPEMMELLSASKQVEEISVPENTDLSGDTADLNLAAQEIATTDQTNVPTNETIENAGPVVTVEVTKGEQQAQEVQPQAEMLATEAAEEVGLAASEDAQSASGESSGEEDASQMLSSTLNEESVGSIRTMDEDSFDTTMNQVSASNAAQTTQTVQTTVETPVAPVQQTTTTYISQTIAQSMITQVSEQIFIQLSEEASTMELQLNPENLGKLIISVTTKASEVSAQIYTESEAVRAALETQLVSLREQLSEQGYKVNAVEVTVEEQAFDRNLDQQAADEESQNLAEEAARKMNRRNLHIGSLDELSGLMSEEETLIATMMKENGNTMDVTA